jgi:hypothetical protein
MPSGDRRPTIGPRFEYNIMPSCDRRPTIGLDLSTIIYWVLYHIIIGVEGK